MLRAAEIAVKYPIIERILMTNNEAIAAIEAAIAQLNSAVEALKASNPQPCGINPDLPSDQGG